MGNAWTLHFHPELMPHPLEVPKTDPKYGFTKARKERVMVATEAQMESAKLPLEDRDYCAHKLINYKACQARVWPFAYQCHHEKHDYLNCEYDDYIIRMKEFERERRLKVRAAQAK